MTGGGRMGKYLLQSVLGRGSMGVVYLARDPQIERAVAVKTVLLPAGLDEERIQEYRERFLREARAAGRLNHPSIVTVYEADSGQWGGAPFIAMEYIEGEPWNRRARKGPCKDVGRVADLARQVASALDYAHRNGVVHRDIKPANIIETPDGRAKLMDFGIAKVPTSELTREGQLLGTPAYMSPEQVRGTPADGRSDLFSLGSVLYEVLTGRKPFPGEEIATVTHRIVAEDPTPARAINPEIPEDLCAVLRHLMAKAPQDRYEDAGQLVEDLEAFLGGARPPHCSHRIAPDPPSPAPAPAPATAPVSPDSRPPARPAPSPGSGVRAPSRSRLVPRLLWASGAVLGLLVLMALAVPHMLPVPPPLDPPSVSALPEPEAPEPPVHLLAQAPRPSPPPPPPPVEVAPTIPNPNSVKPPASAAPLPCTVNYTFTTGIVRGEYWIHVDGRQVEHRVIQRDRSLKSETHAGAFQVVPGTRAVVVRVKTELQNVDSSGEATAEFPEGGTKNLRIVMTKFNKKIKLEWP